MLGRAEEFQSLRALIAGARNGVSGALLVHGDAGVGKTTLIEAALHAAADLRIVRASGYEVEETLPYGALQRLGRPLAPFVDGIPEAQRSALRIAMGLADGAPPQRALVGLGVLSVLARAGDDAPLICVVDDAHHLDAETLEVLGLVARRLSAETVGLVFVSRNDDAVERALAGVPRLALSGLDPDAAAAVLREAVADEIDPAVVAEVVSLTGGNPLALRDLGAELSVRDLTAAAIGRSPVPLGRRLEEHYSDRASALSPAARLWLLVAAAEVAGDASVIRSAARALDLPEAAAAEAESVRLVEIHDSVRFRHPLIRSGLYNAASDADRRGVHATLRDETARRGLRELAAWHAAAACAGPDAAVAAELAAIADLAGARGGLKSRALILARAAELSPDARDRSERFIAGAEAAIGGGAGVLARQLLGRVDRDAIDRVGRGRMHIVEAMCTLYMADAARMPGLLAVMIAGADELDEAGPEPQQRALLLALNSAFTAEDRAVGADIHTLAVRMRVAVDAGASIYSQALGAMASFQLDGYGTALPLLRETVAAFETVSDDAVLGLSIFAVGTCIGSWDCDAASRILTRAVRVGRERGALREVDAALWVLSAVELSRVNPRQAGNYLDQAAELRRALGYLDEHTVNAAYLAWQGAPAATVEQIIDAMDEAGYGGVTRMARGALAIDDIARGSYASAHGRLSQLVAKPYLQASFHHIPELVEAAVRSANRAVALSAAEQMDAYASAAGTIWVRGLAARCAALVADDVDAEPLYLDSIALLDTESHRGDCARSRLVYGEWLRRMRRRNDARIQLQAAHDVFEDVGATAFAERARRELTATGERIEGSQPRNGGLTPQELEVARLAARRETNAEIGSALFISPNTVDYHLRKVFRKLGVSSRRQLAEHFPTL